MPAGIPEHFLTREQPSRYGAKFDHLANTWATLEREHDKQHLDRAECGGVGACSMMRAAHDLMSQMEDELDAWRTTQKAMP